MIRFNETIDAGNRVELAHRHVAETVALLDGSGWSPRGTRRGVTAFVRKIDTVDAADGDRQSRTGVTLARATIPVSRAELFPLVSKPERAPEWDITDRGFTWVEVFEPDDTVFKNLNKPLLRMIDSVLYRVVRPNHEPDRSLYCARSVISSKAPPDQYRRLSQQIFSWAVRDLDANSCELTVMSSEPVGFLPAWLQSLAFVPGWRANLVKIRKMYER